MTPAPAAASAAALVGRTLMVAPPADWIDGSQDWLDRLQPAGVILFRRNLPDDEASARRGIARLHAWAAARGETFLVAMDEEGGFVTQTSRWFPVPPSARALAWAGPPSATREAYAAYGRRLRDLGVNLDFAPVCDVNNNPRNPVIGVRAFGNDPALVADYARAVHAGLAEAGVLSCAKHFPGHGDTDVDSHLALPIVQHDRARIDGLELVPFRAVLDAVPVVMVAHLACPNLGGGTLPATLAPALATDLLRGALGFTGVAVTDAMDMQGVAGAFGVDEAAVRAVLAGCDLLLYCFEIDKPETARTALLGALAAGRLPRARLEEAAARVARLASLAGNSPAPATLPPVAEDEARLRALCRAAIRLQAPDRWRSFAAAARRTGLQLTGGPPELLERFAARLGPLGVRPSTIDLESRSPAPATPLLVLLGERRPLDAARAERLRSFGATHAAVALANLLTPEIDAPIAAAFATRMQSADMSDLMLDEVTHQLFAASPS